MTVAHSHVTDECPDFNLRGYVIISPDASWEQIATDECPSLEAMQKIVGGYIERVKVRVMDIEPAFISDMIVNEDGLSLGLDENPLAEIFYPGTIVGTAILFTGDLRLS